MSTLRLARSARLQRHLRWGAVDLRSQRTASTSAASGRSLRTGFYATAFAVSAGLFTVYYLDARSAIHRYLFTPLLRYALDAETGHKVAVQVLRSGLAPRDPLLDDARLRSQIWDLQLASPVGLAAGFDKDGEAIDGLFGLGFSWVEIGSVTPKPQPGNPRPRVFHLPEDTALINRYGFPSQGHAAVLARLVRSRPANAASHPVLAVNLGKNKASPADSPDDYVAGVRTFGLHADVLVVNVSSPNTPGLRGLQSRRPLETLLADVTQARDALALAPGAQKPKLMLKIAPDLDEAELADIADAVRASGIDGVIVGNTTTRRPATLTSANKAETGGLSGTPLKVHALTALRTLRAHLPASVPLIGCGGIATGADALEYARAGASLVQVYTAFGYDGVGACRRIKDEITAALAHEGTTWAAVVAQGVEAHSLREGEPRGGTIAQLTAQAEELKALLDALGRKIDAPASEGKGLGLGKDVVTSAAVLVP